MPERPTHSFNLEDRTFEFAQAVRAFVRRLPRTLANQEDGKQLIRSSGSVGANYIEANESVSRKDFVYRVKVSRKEAKESRFWLRLLFTSSNSDLEQSRTELVREATELMNIFGAIIRNTIVE